MRGLHYLHDYYSGDIRSCENNSALRRGFKELERVQKKKVKSIIEGLRNMHVSDKMRQLKELSLSVGKKKKKEKSQSAKKIDNNFMCFVCLFVCVYGFCLYFSV